MNDAQVTTVPAAKPLTPAEQRLMTGMAALSLTLMGAAVVLMSCYMYFLPGANSPLSIIPQF